MLSTKPVNSTCRNPQLTVDFVIHIQHIRKASVTIECAVHILCNTKLWGWRSHYITYSVRLSFFLRNSADLKNEERKNITAKLNIPNMEDRAKRFYEYIGYKKGQKRILQIACFMLLLEVFLTSLSQILPSTGLMLYSNS